MAAGSGEIKPETLKRILMTAFAAYFAQMQKDVEVRIATIFKIEQIELPDKVLIAIAEQTSREMVGFIERECLMSGRLEHVVDKLI